jgi:RHS repeat-associated protein
VTTTLPFDWADGTMTLTLQTTPLKAIAYLTYWSDSAIASATYYYTSPTGGTGSGGPGTGTPNADSGNGMDPRRVGVRNFGAYWGGAGEQIDTTSGNLNFSLPILKVLSRGGWSVGVMLNYNSQMWRQDSSGTWLMGYDTGYGIGWQLQIGSLTAVYGAASQLDHYLYTDATGAEYNLSVNNGGVWTSAEGTFMSYDSNTNRVYATDGSFRVMGSVSSGGEQDAGTRYPTQIEDSNGNQIFIQYAPGGGSGGAANTSARMQAIYDPRASGIYNGVLQSPTYTFTYNNDLIPHLISISGQPGESYNFNVASQTLTAPVGSSGFFGTVGVLQTVTPVGLPTPYAFTYAGSGEMLFMTTPLGGKLGWTYGNCAYAGSIVQREVQSRSLIDFANSAFTNGWNFTTGDGCSGSQTYHATTTLADVGAGTSKIYTAGTPIAGYVVPTAYDEVNHDGSKNLHKDLGWILDGFGNVYMNSVTTTLSPGTSGAIQSKSVQTLDAYGNLTVSQVYDYGNLTTPARTYNNYYLGDANYTSRYIRNRLTQATLTTGGSTTYLVFANYYDGNRPPGITQPPLCNNTSPDPSSFGPIPMHDDTNYGTSFTYRGNLTYSTTYSGTNCSAYQSTGVVALMQDATGNTITTSPTAGNYSLPSVLTPNGNSSLATSITYASSWAVTGVTAPNGASATTTYDALGRPVSSTSSDGAVTSYGYTYTRSGSSQTNIQTATICYTTSSTSSSGCTTNAASNGTQWKQTYLDGFGRSLKVISGHDSTPVSEVDTTYAACACSPLGKMSAVSLPYAPGGSSVLTTYTYDGSGRTLTVTKPDLVSKTTYAYSGNNTTTTDPAGKWKTNTTDAFGNLTVVTEPDPNNQPGGTLITNYTYNAVNQLTQVSMPRSNGTQIRSFQWGGSDLSSATNPENGTVSYQYDGAHHVTLRTDAKGQQTHYSYDAYGRLTSVAHGSGGPDVNYYYDANPFDSSFSQSTLGRLAAVTFGGQNFLYNKTQAGTGNETDYYESLTPLYMYSYNSAGRVTGQRFQIAQNFTGNPGSTVINNFDAAYSWDNQGRMTGRNGPDANYSYTYDNMGRLGGMTGGASASAQYNVAGQITSMAYDTFTEARSYNNLMQLTRLTTSQAGVGNVMDMQYIYSATQNNGRIVQTIDGVAGETVNYTYDGLNRLSTAGPTGGSWLQQYTYDGFGNLTGMNGAAVNSFDPATNRLVGGSYDANGLPNSYPYQWDIESRLTSDASGKMFGYDYQGKRVFQVVPNPSTYTPAVNGYFYSISGQKLATMQCTTTCNISSANVYFAGKLIRSNGVTVATDRLGSVRANVNGERMSYYPYGQERTSTADGREKFATYFRDGAGQDYADQRYYNQAGAFWTPDPGGIAAADPSNPGSWNRYLYSLADPVNSYDPTGKIAACTDDGEDECDLSDTGDATCDAGDYCETGGVGGYTLDDLLYDANGNLVLDADGNPILAGSFGNQSIGVTAPNPNPTVGLAPNPGFIAIGSRFIVRGVTGIGASIGGFIGAFLTVGVGTTGACDTLSCSGGGFPSVQYIEANCTPVGLPVEVPSTKKGNQGGKSIEQEYLCSDGNTYTIHTLTGPNGKPIDKHARPGKPKYGSGAGSQ